MYKGTYLNAKPLSVKTAQEAADCAVKWLEELKNTIVKIDKHYG